MTPFGAGTAAGTSTALGVGSALAAGVGSAAGTSTALGTTSNIFPLTISSDGRYLKQSDGTPFLICADTTWSLAVDIPVAGINSFLAQITSQGFNAVMMNVIEHHYTVSVPPKDITGNLPFTKRLDGATFTGSPNGTTGANGTQGQFSSDNYSSIGTQAADWTFPNNTYWVAVENILNACLANNVLVFPWVAYLGFHANDEGWLNEMVAIDAVTGAGGFTGASFADPTKSKLWNYGAWLADRWKAYPHLIWVMGGDYGSNTQTLSTPQRNAVNNVMAGMKSVTTGASKFFTAHWDRPALATDTTLAAGAFDLNLCYCDEATAELTRRGYAAAAGPTFVGEYYYENDLFGGSAPYRRYLYWGFLGGIAGGFFGNEQLWRFDDGTPGTDYTTLFTTQATNDAARQFAFWKARPWWRLKPDGLGGIGTLITAGGGTASPQTQTYVSAAATPEGDLLLAYVPPAHTGTVTVDLTKLAGTMLARWFDPTNATFTSIGSFNNSGTHAFTTPGNNNAGDADWLLVLETTAATAAGTSTATGVGAALAAATGTAAGTSTDTAVGAALAAGVGTSAGTSTTAGVSSSLASGVGTSAGNSTGAGVGSSLSAGVGSAAGTSTAAATGAALAAGDGSSAGTSTDNAVGAAVAAGVGSASGTSTASGISAGGQPGAGSSAGSSTLAAVGASLAAGDGTSAGTSVASAVGSALAAASATSAGSSTVSAIGSALAAASSAAAGTSTASAVGSPLAAGTGTSAGTSTASGVAPSAAGTGTAAGTSTAAAVGSSLANSVGLAPGFSTALGRSIAQAVTIAPKVLVVVSSPITVIIVDEVTVPEQFRQGSTHRPLRAIAYTATARVDFPSEFPGGITFRMVKGSTVITGAATGDDGGNLSYQWASGDLDIVGTYAAYFVGTDGSGRRETLPSGYNLAIEVIPTL